MTSGPCRGYFESILDRVYLDFKHTIAQCGSFGLQIKIKPLKGTIHFLKSRFGYFLW